MEELRESLKKVIHDLYGLDFDPDLTPSPDNISADYSSNAPLKLAKDLHENPMTIAERLANSAFEEHIWRQAKYGATEPRDGGREGAFRKSAIVSLTPPGFLNFTLSDDFLSEKINNLSSDFSSDEYNGKTVVCEFSDPNPFKVLHVGHLYTSIVGNAIANLYEYAGAKVIRANFGGDVGLHVAKTMYALKDKPLDKLTIEDIAKCYIEGTALYDTDETARVEITELNKEIYRINEAGGPRKALSRSIFSDGENTERPNPVTTAVEAEQTERLRSVSRRRPADDLWSTGVRERSEKDAFSVPDLTELYWKGWELSYDYFNQFYDSIGVKFDKFYPESTVANLGLQKVKEQLEKGVYEYSDGAIIFNGEKYGLHTRVFVNKEGVPTYEAKDVGLIFQKYADYHFDKSVVITGNEQKDYMAVVLKSIEQYAPDLVEKTTHLTHGLVKLPGNIKMSSRKGNFLKAVDVLDLVRDELKSEYNSTDETVALAATKYAFLKYKMGGDIIFDPKESVKMTGNSGPYLLYSCVRAKKVLAKGASARVVDDAFSKDISRFSSPETYIPDGAEKAARRADFPGRPAYDVEGEKVRPGKSMSTRTRTERNLVKKILEYKELLDEAVNELAPHKLANFLYELSQTFSRFYENCPVLGSAEESERLKLVKAYLDVMTHGLKILGIEIPEEM